MTNHDSIQYSTTRWVIKENQFYSDIPDRLPFHLFYFYPLWYHIRLKHNIASIDTKSGTINVKLIENK